MVFFPTFNLEVGVLRQTNSSVQNVKIPTVGDNATIQVALQDGDIIATATMFVSQQDIREGIPASEDDDDFFPFDDDEDTEEYDWDDEPYVEDFWNYDID